MCDFGDCKGKKSMLIGNCSYCKKIFCKLHRLTESHNCDSIQICKDRQKDILSKKLLDEKTVKKRIDQI